MADIKKVKLPGSETVYNIVDAGARDLIAELQAYTDYLGVTTTAITDGSTTNPVKITGKYVAVTPKTGDNPKELGWYEYDSTDEEYVLTDDTSVQAGKTYYTDMITAVKGNIVNYNSAEFIWNGAAWNEFGDLSGLGELAFEDTAEGTYTPAGSITQPTVEIGGTASAAAQTATVGGTASAAAQTATVGGTASAAAQTVTLGGTASAAAQSISLTSSSVSIPNVTAVGSMPTYTVDSNGVLEITAGSTPTLGTDISVHDVTAATASASSVDFSSMTATAQASSVDLTSVTVTNQASSVDLASVTVTNQASSVDLTSVTATATGAAFTGTEATITVSAPSE